MKVGNRSGNRVDVRGYSGDGLGVDYWYDDADGIIGVSASRKLL
jgi:hypothetical protein